MAVVAANAMWLVGCQPAGEPTAPSAAPSQRPTVPAAEASLRSEPSPESSPPEVERVVLMKFGAPWCGPCRKVDRELDRLEDAWSDRDFRITRVNVDERPGLARQYGVSSIPHLVLMHDGQVVRTHVGYQSERELRQWVSKYGEPAIARNEPRPTGDVRCNPFAQ